MLWAWHYDYLALKWEGKGTYLLKSFSWIHGGLAAKAEFVKVKKDKKKEP